MTKENGTPSSEFGCAHASHRSTNRLLRASSMTNGEAGNEVKSANAGRSITLHRRGPVRRSLAEVDDKVMVAYPSRAGKSMRALNRFMGARRRRGVTQRDPVAPHS